ncbi:MAG: substrate-binding domain-containing protein [Candidatus Pristimantibacillus lignocellulolyticus]|uniref:Substrate-binding domain-containing protein n=1 Tax=Candidatus Pristimantibacillus lignocellulolyticus TaxID=2994561 RepID=A0A9J6ZFG3_9BACL|nr:MAG: substrate-binding domain-containing protein [Candidatus Pristimantibacillus lignocellulolyticus]
MIKISDSNMKTINIMTTSAATIVVICAFMLLIGCSKSDPVKEKPLTSDMISEQTNSQYTFGIIYPMAHPFYEMITQNAQKTADSLGSKLIVKAPDEANLEQQIRMMETMIKQEVDAIAIAPIDAEALAPTIKKAISKGISIICFESDCPNTGRSTYIGSDNEQAGIELGRVITEKLSGKGMILVQIGMSSMSSIEQRLRAMTNYLEQQSEIQILDVRAHEGSSELALSDLEEMIDNHPHFDAYIAMDPVSISEAVLVWKAMGLNRHAIAFGMTHEVREAMINGQITTIVYGNEQLWGDRIIQSLLKAVTTEPLNNLEILDIATVTKTEIDLLPEF